MITLISVPEHFATADIADIERELIGLLWTARPELDGTPLHITGVRNPHTYHAPNAEWPQVARSRALRTPRQTIAVRYERA